MYYINNLYNSQATDAQDSFEILTESMQIPKLDDAERDAIDSPLTYEECKILLLFNCSSLLSELK